MNAVWVKYECGGIDGMVVAGQTLVLLSPPQITHGLASVLIGSLVTGLGGNCMNHDAVLRRLWNRYEVMRYWLGVCIPPALNSLRKNGLRKWLLLVWNMENVHRYCTYNTLLNAGMELRFIGTGDGRCFGKRDVSRMVLTRTAKEYKNGDHL